MKKKNIALVLLLVLALTICGCTPTTNNSDETTAPGSSSIETTAPDSGSTETTGPDSGNTETTGPDSGNTETTGPDSGNTSDPSAHTHCACGSAAVHTAAAHTCADTTYTALDQATANAIAAEDATATTPYYPIQGTYYLTENVTINGRVRIVGDLDICLNGFELKVNWFRFKGADSYEVNISDCSAANTGKLTGTEKQLFFANAASSDVSPVTINVWGGTISDTATDGQQGLVFALGSATTGNHTLNIYNGTIIGGPVSNQGGVMRLSGGAEVNIYGGTISGGTATSSASKSALGGNIYISSSATKVNIYGGTISGGTAAVGTEEGAKTAQGGNIYLSSGTLTLYGGSVTGGQAVKGANIQAAGGTIKIVGVDAETKITVADGITPDVTELSSTTTVTNDGNEYTATKAGA